MAPPPRIATWQPAPPDGCGIDLEFLIAKTDLAPDTLPTTQDGTRIDERTLPGLEELGDLEPGESGTLTLDLTPGKYLLFCNEEGHFAAGMFAYLTVEP